MLEYIKAIFYGIIEGITEWLPISSTGHLILFERFWNFNSSVEFIDMYRVVIQLGAILAVVILFFTNIWPFGLSKNTLGASDKKIGPFTLKGDIFSLWFKILVACIPTIIYAFLLDDKVSAFLSAEIGTTGFKYDFLVVLLMLVLVGALFIVIENRNKNATPKVDSVLDITYKQALIIGAFQLVAAMLPGTSRSGATIIGALIIGVSRAAAAEFTFYLAIPVMFGASLYKGYKFIDSGVGITNPEVIVLILGMLVAFLVSLIVIKFLMAYIKKHDFKVFGIYRIVLGAVLLLYFLTSIK